MLSTVKKRLYFLVASYFAFWARFVLRRWRPRIILITGSSGKTTLLHLVEAQLGNEAVYSHHANSAVGLPFHMLGLPTNVLTKSAWFVQALKAPFKARRRPPQTKLYIVEADTDRPREGAFLAKLLKPEVTMWVSVYRTHSMNFEPLVKSGRFTSLEDAIAYEFGYFPAHTSRLVLANGEQPVLTKQLERVPTGTEVKLFTKNGVKHEVQEQTTIFTIGEHTVTLPGLHPPEVAIGLQMVKQLLAYLDRPLDDQYSRLTLPPGRSRVFAGKHGTTLIDSTYNTGLGATATILELFKIYPAKQKWLVISDILEQGTLEQEEHERLADLIEDASADQVILLGPRTAKHTYPLLQKLKIPVVSFDGPKEVLDHLTGHLKGGETVLFKGARGLEGVVEQLLADPGENDQLVRREAKWVTYRQKWGLPR